MRADPAPAAPDKRAARRHHRLRRGGIRVPDPRQARAAFGRGVIDSEFGVTPNKLRRLWALMTCIQLSVLRSSTRNFWTKDCRPRCASMDGQKADLKRWHDFLVARPEVTYISYEFTAGANPASTLCERTRPASPGRCGGW